MRGLIAAAVRHTLRRSSFVVLWCCGADEWMMAQCPRTNGQDTTENMKKGLASWCLWRWSLSGTSSVASSALQS